MYLLEEKSFFYLLLALPLLVGLYIYLIAWRRFAQRNFGEKSLLKRLNPYSSGTTSFLKFVFILLALTCLCIALVNPKLGTKLEIVKREGVDVIFAVDVSKSMLAEDIAPNRLEKAKHVVSSIINQLVGDRVGLIAYAANAFPQLPITSDFASAKMFLANMNTDMISSQGTAIDEAIILAKKMFNYQEETNKLLFLISDGEDHGDANIDNLLEEIREEGIKVYTIGIGTATGGPIPLRENRIIQSYKKDINGQTVITRLNGQILEEIAKSGNGKYVLGNDTQKALSFVKNIFQNTNKKEFESKKFSDFKDRFQWFLVLGLFFLTLDILLLERRSKWFERFNLFNEHTKNQ